ncbi:DUF943 family protein [Rahnella sp. PD12R]|uniref:DUF943 family protein n=1 Tax=Rahnella sp. PD12R TaxID=2855688 RepID=UPI001C493C31|nr:DUF943 family protein [Rahnella sp. PD12R]MBV6820165.1 DUF943 family protein [Rahnella sp. PD12R]
MIIKRAIKIIIIAAISICVFFVSKPTSIVDAHRMKSGFSALLIKNPPFTDKGKISWWLKNKEQIRTRFNIPEPDGEGTYTVVILNIDTGYKIDRGIDEDSDLLCFDDIGTNQNCINKDWVMDVTLLRNGEIRYRFDKKSFLQLPNGTISQEIR